MNKCYKIIIIIFLFILIISHICSIIYEPIYLTGDYEIKNIIKHLLISDIIISIIIIIIISIFVYSALCLFSKNQIFIFLICILIFLLIKFTILLIIIGYEEIKFESSDINIVIFIISLQIFFFLITFIFGIYYRYRLNKEIEESPLNRVDEFITEDMYKNILTQSLNPNDKELKKEFEKHFEQRKSESLYNSTFSSGQ